MKPIFLIGYMASGKTTLGRALAREMGVEFIDLDFYIEQRFRAPISRLFAERGEEWFRRIEGNMLREVGEMEDVVISCGGGTPCFGENMEYMQDRGTTVWVDTTVDCIVRRLLVAKVRRPLTEGKTPEELKEFVEKHLTSRLPYYQAARIHFQGDQLETRAQIARTVSHLLPLLPQITH